MINDYKITTVAPVTTGTSAVTSAAIDMAGFDSCLIIVRLGSPAANNNVKLTQCDTTGGSYADLTGSLVGNHATNNPFYIQVNRPLEQFLKYVITRGTTTTVDIVTIIQYNAKGVRPVTQPAGTVGVSLYHVAEGTA